MKHSLRLAGFNICACCELQIASGDVSAIPYVCRQKSLKTLELPFIFEDAAKTKAK
jgi:hypothetical protein